MTVDSGPSLLGPPSMIRSTALPSWRQLLPFTGATLAYWLLNVVAIWVLSFGFGLDFSFGQATAVITLVGIGIMIPGGPGFLGNFELFAKELFVGHPYRFRTIGTEDSLKRIDREALGRYYEAYAKPSNGVLAIVGDVQPDRIVEAIASKLAEWEGPESVELPRRELPPVLDGPREVSIEKNKAQVHIVLGFPGLAVDDPDLPALDVLTQILSGQGGRLFLELRDKRSLAYSVNAFSFEGVDPGSFGVYIASAPEKLEESLEGVRRELRRVLEEPIAPEELERAKGFLIGTHAVSLQRYGSQASLLSLDELYGLGADHHLGYGERIAAVTIDDLKRVSQRLIHLERPLVAIIR